MLKYLACPRCRRRSGINIYKVNTWGKFSFQWDKPTPIRRFLCEECGHIFEACVYTKGRCRRCQLRVDCLSHNVTGHIENDYPYETNFVDPDDVGNRFRSFISKGGGPPNFTQPPIFVTHAWLCKLNDDNPITSLCPKCGGVLPVARDRETLELSERDRCLNCGQTYIYMDIEKMKEKYA